ncbi:MAG: hypothetical protein ACREL5_09505 [Gemmatimonadales bacterium]
MDPEIPPSAPLFVQLLAWPGRRPSHAEMATWHEALRHAVANEMPADLVACWLYPSRGGHILVGPAGLEEDRISPPAAEPLVAQESLYALEDLVMRAGYGAAMAVPIRAEVQDVGLLLVASFSEAAYGLGSHRTLHRIAGQLATGCRRLAAQAWVVPSPASDERTAMVAGVTEGLLDAIDRARDGGELVQLCSDALANQLPHDRLELIAAAPAPECWTLLSLDRTAAPRIHLEQPESEAIDTMVRHFGGRELLRIADLHDGELVWPGPADRRSAGRMRGVVASRLDVGGEFVGWLCLASESPGWFRDDDEPVARLAARILAPRVAAWEARAELAGTW